MCLGDVRGRVAGRGAAAPLIPNPQVPELAAALPAYEIGPAIGGGTFGIVYAARHRVLGRDAAIKQLWPELVGDRDARRAFSAEACLLASLEHPHVVRVYDYVEENAYALVLEHMGGGTLRRLLRAGPMSVQAACTIALDLLDALEYAHQRGVLHRDIKPANLLLSAAGSLKLADFGLAKLIHSGGMTTTGAIHQPGTPAYMAPEQLGRSLGSVCAATDVWAAGAVLYEMLAGRRPFAEVVDFDQVLIQRVARNPRPLTDIAPHVPSALSAVVDTALMRLPADRFQTAAEFATALRGASTLRSDGWDPRQRSDPLVPRVFPAAA
jgi:serine/threonine-protein kinase